MAPHTKSKTTPWAKGFQLPSERDVEEALGTFPCQFDPKWRRDALMAASEHGIAHEFQLNVPGLFESKGMRKLRHPTDPHDWLANTAEEGQTFNDYVTDISLRSGRFNSRAASNRTGGILLVPIIRKASKTAKVSWPDAAPDLEELRRFTYAFFGESIPVVLSKPAFLQHPTKKQLKAEWIPPQGSSGPSRWVEVRRSSGQQQFDRLSVYVESILTCLCDLTTGFGLTNGEPHSVVGVTFEDLFSHDSDLFIAGLAAGASHVAAFSLFRYHPQLKMSPMHWWKYGFTTSRMFDSYSYFEETDDVQFLSTADGGGPQRRGRKRKRTLHVDFQLSLNESAKRESLRRAVKLLCHEIAHLFIVDHCIYKSCLMNGTGHLVEDFLSPPHLCGIDLRKLQFRLGFDVVRRYEALAEIWEDWGFSSEAKWCRLRQLEASKCIEDAKD